MAKKNPPSQEATNTEPEDISQVTSSVTGEGTVPVLDGEASGIVGIVEMPEVQQNAVDAAREDAAESVAATTAADPPGTPIKGKTDDKGRMWDPSIHENPMRLNKSGYIALRRGGAGAGKNAGKTPASKCEAPAAAGTSPALEPDAKIEASAGACAGLFFVGAVAIGGEDLAPDESKNEKETIKGYFADYFRAKGVIDIPPGIALAAGLGMYVATKWNRPVFTARRKTIWEKVGRWWNDFRWRRQNVVKAEKVDAGADKVKE